MTKLYLIRHAQSENNVLLSKGEGLDGRSSDPELSELGHQQASMLAQSLTRPSAEPVRHPHHPGQNNGFEFTHVYCSLMTRAVLTAGYIARACDLKLQALPDIFEKFGIYQMTSSGVMQGLPGPDRNYFTTRFADLCLPDDFNDSGWWNRPAEDEKGFTERVRKVVGEFKQYHDGRNDCIAMVAHREFIDQFINELMGVERHGHNYRGEWDANWTFHNTSISRIDFANNAHHVVYLNRFDHLTAELTTW